MSEDKTSVSKANTYREIGEFWDNHSISDYWDETENAHFELAITSEVCYFALDKQLFEKVEAIALKHDRSPKSLITQWLEEKIHSFNR
ncbi:hypothetical protein MCHI_002403 [Candidatus Magnetoovum chiemensis]|nr:hypothetical protein MCHI_002403 [Candidatus Magnetoovum chiemensis]